MPEFAKQIKVERKGRNARLIIDGETFPYYVTADGVTVTQTATDEMPSITLTILAEDVQVSNRIAPVRSWQGKSFHRDPTGPLARAETARDQAEELLANAQKALEENHATIADLHTRLAVAEGAEEEKGTKVGTAYIKVLPDFSAFDAVMAATAKWRADHLSRTDTED